VRGCRRRSPILGARPGRGGEENLRRLDLALEHINARRPDGSEPAVETTDYSRDPVVELQIDHGELKFFPYPVLAMRHF
jgi:hypothetical protein